jgi:cytochrome c oxidase assembly protein subunit 15
MSRSAVARPRFSAARILIPASAVLLFLQAALVVTGGAVRLTGSGLGCPTWPECTPGSYTPVPHQAEPVLNVWIEFGNRMLTFALVLASLVLIVTVLKSGRRDLRSLAVGQFLGIFGQGILGGITVLTGLHPITVALHLLLSMVLIAGATSIHIRRFEPSINIETSKLTRSLAILHVLIVFLVMILGTVVTGSGPHAGDAQAERFTFDIRTVAILHADFVIFLFGVTIAFFVAVGTSAQTKIKLRTFTIIALAQGIIGYVQYFLGVPALIVGLHLLGAAVLWISAWRVFLSSRIRMDAK